MSGYAAFVCFVVGTVAFIRFFLLAPRLRKERIGPPATQLELWFPWLPGKFTPEGTRLRRRMNRFLLVGWVLLVAGWFLSPG